MRDRVYLTYTGFSIADTVVSYTLRWAAGYGLLGDHPGLEAYLNRHLARGACPEELRR